jgi:hypothetical protein
MADQLAEPEIAPLSSGEERLLETVYRSDGNRNCIYLVHRRPGDDETMGTGEPINFVAIIRSTDEDSNDTSPPWAWQRGPTERIIYIRIAESVVNAPLLPGTSADLHPDVQWFVDRIREQPAPAGRPMHTAAEWIPLYVSACNEVLDAANACLDAANRSLGARRKIAEHQYDGLPGTPTAIRNFAAYAEQAERDFTPLYEAFEQACAVARDTAAALRASSPGFGGELLLSTAADDAVLDQVATVKGILGATYGPTPAAFIEGVNRANELMQNPPDEGNIFHPPLPAAAPDEHTCPSCSAPVDGAAMICQACGADLRARSAAG